MIRLYLMGEKGQRVLNRVVREKLGASIADVVVGRDKSVQDDFADKIISFCRDSNIQSYERRDCPEHHGWALAVSWRWLILNFEQLVVFHDSLLPRYRGFAPLVTALKNGDKEVGVTAIFASEQYDEGKIISQARMPVRYPIQISEAVGQISSLYCDLVTQIINKISSGAALPAIEQDHSAATYSLWLDAEDYSIDWSASSEIIERHVHATGYPYAGAKTSVDGRTMTVLDGAIVDDVVIERRTPGKVIFIDSGNPVVVCGAGLYKITEMIDEDGTSMLPLKRFRSRFK